MFNLISYNTCDLSKKEKIEIIKLKDSHWKFGIRKQILYYNKTFKNKDLNNLLYYKKKLVGFTALRKSFYRVNKIKKFFYIFDTLIINKNFRKKKFGNLLMYFNNLIIFKTKLPAFLICKKRVVKFYKKYGWKISKNNNVFPNNKSKVVMILKP